MNYFEQRLETQLRLMLDPIVKTTAPPRTGSRRRLIGTTRVLELPVVTPAAVLVPMEVFA